MPGLFDNIGNHGGLLGLLMGNNPPGGIAGSMNPALRQNALLGQGYNYLSNQTGDPGEAALAISDPQAYAAAFQRQLFMGQLQNLMGPDPNHPKMSLNEALFRLSQPGQEQQYLTKPVPGFKTPSGREAPGTMIRGQITAPGGMGFQGNAGPEPQTMAPPNSPAGTGQPTASPGVGGSPGPVSSTDQADINWFAAKSAAEAKAKAAGALQPGFPAALSDAHQKIAQINEIINNPRLNEVVGRVAGGLPARYSSNPDLVNSINTLDNAIRNQTFQGLRTISTGRPPSAGTIKDMQIGSLSDARLGSVEGLQAEGRRLIKQIQDETDAAWVGANSPAEYKPAWGNNAQGAAQSSQPNDKHLQWLRAHPDNADQFDAKFGKGAAQKVLGNAQRL